MNININLLHEFCMNAKQFMPTWPDDIQEKFIADIRHTYTLREAEAKGDSTLEGLAEGEHASVKKLTDILAQTSKLTNPDSEVIIKTLDAILGYYERLIGDVAGGLISLDSDPNWGNIRKLINKMKPPRHM